MTLRLNIKAHDDNNIVHWTLKERRTTVTSELSVTYYAESTAVVLQMTTRGPHGHAKSVRLLCRSCRSGQAAVRRGAAAEVQLDGRDGEAGEADGRQENPQRRRSEREERESALTTADTNPHTGRARSTSCHYQEVERRREKSVFV